MPYPPVTSTTVTVATSPVTITSFTPGDDWYIRWSYLVTNQHLTNRGGEITAAGDISDNIDEFYDTSTVDNVDYLTKPAAPTAALAGTTGSNTAGVHSIKVTFVTENGETEPSDASGNVTVTGAGEDITATVAVCTQSACTARKIYMNTAGGATYYLAATIPNNTGTTATIDVDDVTLATHAAAPSANTSAQADSTALTFDMSSSAGVVSLTATSTSGDWIVKTEQIARII